MVVENPLPEYFVWLGLSMWAVLWIVIGLASLATVLTYLVQAFRIGPIAAIPATGQFMGTMAYEMVHISPRRVYSLARLAFQESIRRKVIVAFIVFAGLMLMAGWFLDVKTDHPSRLYLAFVFWSTNVLILVLAAVLSTMSLPADIKSHTIYTIVTKPVYAWEIVLGRIVGFGAIGSVILLAMCLVSYLFVVRGLSHRHEIDPADVANLQAAIELGESDPLPIYTSSEVHHKHELYFDEEGELRCRETNDHWHEIEVVEEDGEVTYELGPPRGDLQSRVAIYGDLRFYDSQMRDDDGTNVGKEWTYQSFIEGGTDAAAVWRFEGITEEEFPEGLPLDLSLRVFRTHKGVIERRILGEIFLARPNLEDPAHPLVVSAPITFQSEEFKIDRRFMSRQQRVQQPDGTTVPVDLFDDNSNYDSLVDDEGRVEVWLRCAEPQQYFGVAERDLYIKRENASFELNFFKGYISMWLQMMVVIGFGVMYSTFLNAPVALLATVVSCLVGFSNQFIFDVASGKAEGGGPIEAMIRIFTHANLVTDLEQGPVVVTIIESIDGIIFFLLQGIATILPNFREFYTAHFISSGYNIPANYIAIPATITFIFLGLVSVAGYIFFKSREIAA